MQQTFPPAPERHVARNQQQRRNQRNVEGQYFDDQRGSDVGAQHDGKRRYESDHAVRKKRGGHHGGSGAALKQRGDRNADADCHDSVTQHPPDHSAQIRPESTNDPALDHVHAPEEQDNGTSKLDQSGCCGYGIRCCSGHD